jgi:hypothetical protein
MSSTCDQDYGLVRRAAITALTGEPKLTQICRMMRGGILAHPWVTQPDIAAWLEKIKPAHRERAAWKLLASTQRYMDWTRDQIRAKYDRDVAAPAFTCLPRAGQALYEALIVIGIKSGPDVMASTTVLVGMIYDMTGCKYSRKYIVLLWKSLVAYGFLEGVTSGVSHQGYVDARSNVYHLLPDGYFTSYGCGQPDMTCEVSSLAGPSAGVVAQVIRFFEEAIDRVRRLRWLLANEGRRILESDYFRSTPVRRVMTA